MYEKYREKREKERLRRREREGEKGRETERGEREGEKTGRREGKGSYSYRSVARFLDAKRPKHGETWIAIRAS